MLKVVKRWYGDIADLWAKHKLVVLMRDNAGEYKSEKNNVIFGFKRDQKSCQYTERTMAEWSGRINNQLDCFCRKNCNG